MAFSLNNDRYNHSKCRFLVLLLNIQMSSADILESVHILKNVCHLTTQNKNYEVCVCVADRQHHVEGKTTLKMDCTAQNVYVLYLK